MARNKNICWFLIILFYISVIEISCKGNKKNITIQHDEVKDLYTCPMHPQIIRDKPGDCPICGMALVKKESNGGQITDIKLETLLKPSNEFVISAIPVITMEAGEESVKIEALGATTYDTRMIGNIAAKVSGRIEKLYVRYNFQDISAGQKVMDIYSLELMTAQQNLLFLLKRDPGNTSLINAAKEKLLLLGISSRQLQQVILAGSPSFTISVYSNYSGHIHGAENMSATELGSGYVTREFNIKEGMYVQKGQTVFAVYNPHFLWALLNIYTDQLSLVKKGNKVHIISEVVPGKSINGKIDFIEPFFRKDSKTLTARVYFENSTLHIPVGSQVKATIYSNAVFANWLPKDAVISLGLDKIVFLKGESGFKAHKVEPGISYNNKIQIISGLSTIDSIAANAQYLADSESFIKINN